MTDAKQSGADSTFARGRVAGWGFALLVFLAPLIAMQFTDEVTWGAGDFLVFGAMLIVAGLGIELTVRMTPGTGKRILRGAGILAVFIVVWVVLALD